MRRAACLLAALSAGPARADTALLDFIGGQGCTFGQDSRAAARDAGFDDAAIDALIAAALAQGTARRQGDFVVLDATVCTIRLPDIRSDWSVTSPRIAAWISPSMPLPIRAAFWTPGRS